MNLIEKAARFFNFPLIDSAVKVYLHINQHEFLVDQFKIDFMKPIDDKGEPQGETRGGQFVVTLSQTVPEDIYQWILGLGVKKSGELIFKNQISNAPLKLEFFNAACVNFTRETNAYGGLMTVLYIAPQRLLINGVEHDNEWNL